LRTSSGTLQQLVEDGEPSDLNERFGLLNTLRAIQDRLGLQYASSQAVNAAVELVLNQLKDLRRPEDVDRLTESTRGDELNAISTRLDGCLDALKEMATLQLLDHVKKGTFDLTYVLEPNCPTGKHSHYVICNSVPKSGTYLLMEVIRDLRVFEDCHHHVYSNGIAKLRPDGSLENLRAVPALMWAAALRPGMMCASHLEYSPYLENYLLSRKDHKMLFIIRDPRDIVISWVDFVYNSKSFLRMRPIHESLRDGGRRCYPTDAERITSAIENVAGQKVVSRFASWVHSPACLTIRFEDIYGELTECSNNQLTIDRICDYLEVPRKCKSSFAEAIGRGLTSSERPDKIGIYKRRMNEHHFEKLRDPEFQRLVIEMGYAPTP
jgi:hypothetical protein